MKVMSPTQSRIQAFSVKVELCHCLKPFEKKKQKMQVSHRIKTGKIAWQKREITAGITLS